MGTAIGIDLGTTRTCAAVWKEGRVHIIPSKWGRRFTPSVVAYTSSGVLVGDKAKERAVLNSRSTVFNIKRIIGKEFDDIQSQDNGKYHNYNLVDLNDEPHVQIERDGVKSEVSPKEISAQILLEVRRAAGEYLGEEVTEAVVTAPAYFNNNQRQATLVAATVAGFAKVSIINEPTAAAIAYGLDYSASL